MFSALGFDSVKNYLKGVTKAQKAEILDIVEGRREQLVILATKYESTNLDGILWEFRREIDEFNLTPDQYRSFQKRAGR